MSINWPVLRTVVKLHFLLWYKSQMEKSERNSYFYPSICLPFWKWLTVSISHFYGPFISQEHQRAHLKSILVIPLGFLDLEDMFLSSFSRKLALYWLQHIKQDKNHAASCISYRARPARWTCPGIISDFLTCPVSISNFWLFQWFFPVFLSDFPYLPNE